MNISTLILRNLRNNLKNYYLYVFALIFSVALYFAFVTLQYDPAMDEIKGGVKGAASIRTASILLVAIVSVFLVYANNIFVKRRSKEIGLFQLIGMTKNHIYRILTAENFILYFGSLAVGILLGFSVSKLVTMTLFKIIGIDVIATLHFSTKALLQTVIVFAVIYLLIMLMNFLFIKKQTILALFRITSSSEDKIKTVSRFEMVIGILGIVLIIGGYYLSSKLFDGDFTKMNELFIAMITILGSVIIGTYLVYKGSVRFIFHTIRKRKGGYLNITEVLSLSSIMFRMKSNALLLTIITTISALAIGLLSLSYISYFSAGKSAANNVAADFAITDAQEADQFEQALSAEKIDFTEKRITVIRVMTDLTDILAIDIKGLNFDPSITPLSVISDNSVENIDVQEDEVIFTGYSDLMQKFMTIKNKGEITLNKEKFTFLGLKKEAVVSWYFTNGGLPLAIVDKKTFENLSNDKEPSLQMERSLYVGITLDNEEELKKADSIFQKLGLANEFNDSRYEISNTQKQLYGLMMFIVGFLGLTFLITSGCILYFKQMDESEDEKGSYTILRKLGFTQADLLKGIKVKQLYNFGIPLLIGLLHSYFAVKSGWFFFGTELWTPMFIVMALYTALYSIFGLLSVSYYKKIIKAAL